MHSARHYSIGSRVFRGVRLAACLRGLAPLAGPALLVTFCVGCAAQLRAQPITPLAQQTAPPDAVIELWEQHWTLNADGSTSYREKKRVLLNNDRAYGEFADPRITYNVNADKLEILQARTRLPNGDYVELPDYAHVMVSPNESAGWPAFAAIRQHLLVMSGVEPGCVLEVEYRITSKPGTKPYLAADVRLDSRYPVKKHVVRVDVPPDVEARTLLSGVAEGTEPDAGGGRQWTFTDLPAVATDRQSPPWRTRCARFAFSTAGRASQWLKRRHAQLDTAADDSELITKLATEWTKDLTDDSEKVRALQEKLATRFNFVDFPVSWQPATIRPASEVIECGYGLPAEAAAVLLALGRAIDLPVMPGILVNQEVWSIKAPQDGMVANYVVLLIVGKHSDVRMIEVGDGSGLHLGVFDTGDYPEIWDAHHGRIRRDSHWSSHRVLPVPDVLMPRTLLEPWTDPDESQLRVSGKLTLADDGKLAGELSLRTTGLFVSPEELRANESQKRRIGGLLKRVVPGLKVESFSVKTLDEGVFDVVAEVKSSEPLEKLGQAWWVALGEDGPFMAEVGMPLAYGRRVNPVRLAGAFDEQIDLAIEWPEGWTVEALPGELPAVSGEWGSVEQRVQRDGHSLRLERHTRVNQRDMAAADFLTLREPLNKLRGQHARTLLLAP